MSEDIALQRLAPITALLTTRLSCSAIGKRQNERQNGLKSVVVICITKTRLFKYIEILLPKTESFQIKILIFFSFFCSKHRLWVLVRTASPRRF